MIRQLRRWRWDIQDGIMALATRRERLEGHTIPNGISWQRPNRSGSGRWCLHIRAGNRRLVVGWWVVTSLTSVLEPDTDRWKNRAHRTRVPFWAYHRQATDDLHGYLPRS